MPFNRRWRRKGCRRNTSFGHSRAPDTRKPASEHGPRKEGKASDPCVRRPGLDEINLGFAGRQRARYPVYRAIATLAPGDPLEIRVMRGRWELLDRSAAVVGRLARAFEPPAGMCCVTASVMLAKLASRNRLTLPKAVLASCRGTKYFDVTEDNGRIVLTPVRINRADAVRAKLADLGMTEDEVAGAVAWARADGKQEVWNLTNATYTRGHPRGSG